MSIFEEDDQDETEKAYVNGSGGKGAGTTPTALRAGEFTVMLMGSGDKKIQVIKVVRELTGLGLREVRDLVDGAPKPVKEGISKAEAAEVKKKIEDAGGSVELKPDQGKSWGKKVEAERQQAAKKNSNSIKDTVQLLADEADTILGSGGILAVAYAAYRSTVIETTARVRFERCDFESYMIADSKYEYCATERSREFCWSVHNHFEYLLGHRQLIFDGLIRLRTESELLALIGAAWGEFLKLSEKVGAQVPASELLRTQGLTVLPAAEDVDGILSCTMRLAGLLKYAADAGRAHSDEPGTLGGVAILWGDRHGASD